MRACVRGMSALCYCYCGCVTCRKEKRRGALQRGARQTLTHLVHTRDVDVRAFAYALPTYSVQNGESFSVSFCSSDAPATVTSVQSTNSTNFGR